MIDILRIFYRYFHDILSFTTTYFTDIDIFVKKIDIYGNFRGNFAKKI